MQKMIFPNSPSWTRWQKMHHTDHMNMTTQATEFTYINVGVIVIHPQCGS